MHSSLRTLFLVGLLLGGLGAFADADINLSGSYTTDQSFTATSDTTVNLSGVTFTECRLQLVGDVTFTLNLVDGTLNQFTRESVNDYCIKATKNSNIVITGGGSLDIYSKKKLGGTTKTPVEGLLNCNNLTVNGGTTTVTFDNDKSDTPCIFLKGNYLQTAGKMKVESAKKNCTNELVGVYFDTKNTSFTMEGGTFSAEMAGTKSRAINLKKTGTAIFRGGTCKMEFEGPQARFVSGGTLNFEGGEFSFTTNITAKMTAEYYPTSLSAVKADYSIAIFGGDFKADLPLLGSEVFTTDSETGTSIDISGGTFDLVAGDDCISATGDINISGGRIRAVSVFDDALDANGNLTITGGDIRAYATATETHGLDVNKGRTLSIRGGIVVATDGLEAIPIGAASSEVGSTGFSQATVYQTLDTAAYGGRYLSLDGMTNGVAFTLKPRLPDLAAGHVFNLLVSVPGRGATTPSPLTVAEAYADATSSNPLVFEKKATVSGHTITTAEGDQVTIPEHYDLTPAEGKSKTVTLALNELATPEYADPVKDGVAAIAVTEGQVGVGVKTRGGLRYQLLQAVDLVGGAAQWSTEGTPVMGDGTVKVLSADASGRLGFFKVRVSD